MRRSSLIALLVVVGCAGGVWMYSHRVAANERAALASQLARAESLRTQLEKLQRERTQAEQAAAEITRELLQATTVATSEPGAKHSAQTQPWLEKMKRLRGLFAERPDQSSPELTLLTELDWIELAQTIPSEDDDRQMRFRVRDFANERFFALLRVALRDRAIRTNNTPLTDPMQLQPFFRPAIDPAILAGYEVAPELMQPRYFSIAPRAPVDFEYDIRRSLSLNNFGPANGTGSMSGPWVFAPVMKAQTEAREAYQAANGKSPTKTGDLLPYATTPTARAIFDTWFAYQKAHDGKSFSKTADLLPYVTDPEVRSLFESMVRAEERRLLRAQKRNP